MNPQSKLVISLILLILIFWLIRYFIKKRLNSGQTLFWLCLLFGAEIFTLFPSLVVGMAIIWGNLVPVSWISFSGIVFLIFYLLYQTTKLNKLQSQMTCLSRNIAFLEARLRDKESHEKQFV